MRNLKKVLSLVLCMAMMLSIMVVGAGAAFKDQEKINNAEAVDACVALNIINGYTDGSYRPEGTITRAEACKMICVALNGGKEPALGTSATASFTDTKGHWAEGYIESCVSQGIVAGIGGGKFNPDGNVTGSQFAKMLLIALGYKADVEGFTGSAWEVNVNVKATQKDLYDELASMDPSVALTRDNAAQMLWNALQAKEVAYEYTLVSENGQLVSKVTVEDKGITLLKDKYNAGVYEGVLTGSGDFGASKDKLAMTVKAINGVDYTDKEGNTSYDDSFKYAEDVTSLVGQYVKVLVNNKGEVYGVFTVPSENTVVTSAFDKVEVTAEPTDDTDGKVKIDGTEYKLDKNISVVSADGTAITLTTAMKKVASADKITFISNNGDNKFDTAIINPLKGTASNNAMKVTYVSDTSFVAGGTTYKFSEVKAPKDIAKDDYVVYNKDLYTGDKNFIILDEVTGKITATKDSGKEVQIDGTWYKVGNTVSDSPFAGALIKSGSDAALKSTVTIQVLDNIIYNVKIEKAGSTDTAVVRAATGNFDVDGNYQVKLLFADGTTKVVAADEAYESLDGKLVTYEIKNGLYELKAVANIDGQRAGGDFAVVDKVETGFTKASKTVDGKKVASDAVVYVAYKAKTDDTSLTYKVMTGSELNALNSNFIGTTTYVEKDGLITIAYITKEAALPGSNADQLYGYITSEVLTNSNDEGTNKSFTVYTTEGKSVDVVDKNATQNLAKGVFIKFDLSSDNTVENVVVLNTVEDNVNALRNFGTDYIQLYAEVNGSNLITLDDDVKYLIVNTDDVAGVGYEASGLAAASGTGDPDEYFGNVSYVMDGEKAVLVIVDATGQWHALSDGSVVEVIAD